MNATQSRPYLMTRSSCTPTLDSRFVCMVVNLPPPRYPTLPPHPSPLCIFCFLFFLFFVSEEQNNRKQKTQRGGGKVRERTWSMRYVSARKHALTGLDALRKPPSPLRPTPGPPPSCSLTCLELELMRRCIIARCSAPEFAIDMTDHDESCDYWRRQTHAIHTEKQTNKNALYFPWSVQPQRIITVQMSVRWPFQLYPHLESDIMLACEWFAVKPKAYHVRFDGPPWYERLHQGATVMKLNATVFVFL